MHDWIVRGVLRASAKRESSLEDLGWREPGTRQTVLGLEMREAAQGIRRNAALLSSELAIVEMESRGAVVVVERRVRNRADI